MAVGVQFPEQDLFEGRIEVQIPIEFESQKCVQGAT